MGLTLIPSFVAESTSHQQYLTGKGKTTKKKNHTGLKGPPRSNSRMQSAAQLEQCVELGPWAQNMLANDAISSTLDSN